MLKVNDINVYYGSIHAIKGVSFDVNEGEIVTLIGANGAGKSTILNSVSGLLNSNTGDIEFLGESIKPTLPHKIVEMGLAQVPEGRRIFQNMSVKENLEMGAYTRKQSEIYEAVEDVFRRFPRLAERRKQIGGTLSGGEQQMLAIGRALMGRPKILLLDEPSLGLAPLIIRDIFDIIVKIKKRGQTILIVEQNAYQTLKIADYAYIMELGKIKYEGTGQQLLSNDDLVNAYLGSN